ncbi:MAG: alpha-1,2-fucosyltransferase [Lachnospiraceae bacterium]|nr:alpha-1,2-fucosyltransferase [Lachnospiraceae bacterium]
MIIIRVMGGLGNQLQQYALYKKLESMGKDVRLDISWFRNADVQESILAERELELERLEGISCQAATPEEIRSVLGRLWEEKETAVSKFKRKLMPASDPCFRESDMYHEQVFQFADKYLVGYWACEKYYADILEMLRQEIRFPEASVLAGDDISSGEAYEISGRNKEMINKMQETESVSVHIRRGDYLDAANRPIFGGISTKDYYKAAIDFLKERYPQAVFFFFSDDIPYVREHYREEACEIIDWNNGRNSVYDMMLMSCCKHNICANSTFSFWGARLNPCASKVMIRPSIHKNTQICIPEQMKDLWAGWTLITPQGRVL